MYRTLKEGVKVVEGRRFATGNRKMAEDGGSKITEGVEKRRVLKCLPG